MKKITLSIIPILLIIVGYVGYTNLTPQKNTQVEGQQMVHSTTPEVNNEAMNMNSSTEGSTLASTRIVLDNKDSLKPGKVNFSFKLFGIDKHEFTDADLKVAHEKKMHFIFVRDDMTGYQHIHPQYTNGKWAVTTDIDDGGNYNLYVDIAPSEESPVVLRVPLQIGGTTVTKNFPTPNEKMNVTSGVYTGILTTNVSLKTNQEIKLSIAITKDGKAVTEINQYLGAFGHLVILNHSNPNDFIHAHPLTETKPANGVVEFMAKFPVKGTYTLYGQFNVGGGIITLPITIAIKEDGAVEATNVMNSHMSH